VSRVALGLPMFVLVALALPAQQQPSTQPSSAQAGAKPPSYAAIPVQAAKQENPVKSTPESLARAAKWWNMDCAMCHGKTGDGKGETAHDMKLTMVDLTDPATLKSRTDGEIYYIIKNGHDDMPPEGPRIKTEEGWDLVNYVRSLANKKTDADQKPAAADQKPQ
jgi:mono/diheme cytochrome c family protein